MNINETIRANQKLVMKAVHSAARRCRVVLTDTAFEDAVQDANVKLVTALAKYDASRAELSTFIHTVAWNLTVQGIRSERNPAASYNTISDSFTREPSGFANDGNVSDDEACAVQVSGSDERDNDTISTERAREAIERVLSRLSERDRDIFISIAQDDSQENAVRLARKWNLGHVPQGTPPERVGWFLARAVRTLVSRIRATLRAMLEADEPEPA